MTRARRENAGSIRADAPSARRSRRQALALGGAAAAAAAVAALGVNGGKKAHADTGDPLFIGAPNEANPGDVTKLFGQVHPGPVFHLRNDAQPSQEKWDAVALDAMSREGTAVVGTTFGPADGGYGTRGLSYIGSPDSPSEEWIPGPGIGVGGMSGSGPGVLGQSLEGPGVSGVGGGSGPPGPEGPRGPGVLGRSQNAPGVRGESGPRIGDAATVRAGVEGVGPIGVWGSAAGSGGVQGTSQSSAADADGKGRPAAGVLGEAWGDALAGVVAWSGGGGPLALAVIGKAAFTGAGAAVVPARMSAATVPNPAVTADSHITVTLTGDPGSASVAWVERQPGTGFIVHLSSRPRWNVPITYLIVEPVM